MTDYIPTQNAPKSTSGSLDLQPSDCFVVREGLLFNYYSMKAVFDKDRPIIKMAKRPPVIREGVAIVKKKLYAVTVDDLMRGVIRKSREIKREQGHAGNTTSTEPVSQTVQHSDESAAQRTALVEESELADASWQEQIGALHSLVSAKEGGEWEVSEDFQPG